MNRKVMSILLIVALTCAFVLMPATAAAQATGGIGSIPITNHPVTLNGAPATFNGVLQITRFADVGGQLTAIGTLTGTVTDAAGNVLRTVAEAVTLPVASISATCQILHLVLGPPHLDLLGLVIDLNQVVLDITAQQAGGLLGQLLSGLLCSTNPSNLLINLLNQILRR